MQFRFTTALWEYDGDAAWHFVTLPTDVTDAIDDAIAGTKRRGFGSVPVQVRIGSSSWKTSVFPSKQEASYILPVKKAVRTAEGIAAGDRVTVQLEVVQGPNSA